MLDTARNFFSVDKIFEILDSMMLGKINVFHWHMIDDDSWPLDIKAYPDLAEKAAFSKREIYSMADVKKIVEYAAVRGITVVPEIEGPAHMHALAFEEDLRDLIGCYRDPSIIGEYHGGPPNGAINPLSDKTFDFFWELFTEL